MDMNKPEVTKDVNQDKSSGSDSHIEKLSTDESCVAVNDKVCAEKAISIVGTESLLPTSINGMKDLNELNCQAKELTKPVQFEAKLDSDVDKSNQSENDGVKETDKSKAESVVKPVQSSIPGSNCDMEPNESEKGNEHSCCVIKLVAGSVCSNSLQSPSADKVVNRSKKDGAVIDLTAPSEYSLNIENVVSLKDNAYEEPDGKDNASVIDLTPDDSADASPLVVSVVSSLLQKHNKGFQKGIDDSGTASDNMNTVSHTKRSTAVMNVSDLTGKVLATAKLVEKKKTGNENTNFEEGDDYIEFSDDELDDGKDVSTADQIVTRNSTPHLTTTKPSRTASEAFQEDDDLIVCMADIKKKKKIDTSAFNNIKGKIY